MVCSVTLDIVFLYIRFHDKRLSVLGFCSLLQCSRRPKTILERAHHFVPAIIVQLNALVQAYEGNVRV